MPADFLEELRTSSAWRNSAREWAEELDLDTVLTIQEQEITWLRFGPFQLSQREIAAVLDRAQQLVSRLERRALKKASTILMTRLPPSARSPERTPPRNLSTPIARSSASTGGHGKRSSAVMGSRGGEIR